MMNDDILLDEHIHYTTLFEILSYLDGLNSEINNQSGMSEPMLQPLKRQLSGEGKNLLVRRSVKTMS